jgi:hypothetical protein
LLELRLALEDYLSVDAGVARNDDEGVLILVKSLVLLQVELDRGEASVVCTFAQKWNLLVGAGSILDDLAKAVVGIVEAILVLSAAFNVIGHGRRLVPARGIRETHELDSTAVLN